jgi:hypothetical protein
VKTFPSARIRIFHPGNRKHEDYRFSSPPGKLWTPEGIDAQLAHTAEELEKRFAGEEYRLVPLGGNRFNFVHQGKRADEGAQAA